MKTVYVLCMCCVCAVYVLCMCCVCAGLKNLFASSQVFKFVVEWNPVIRNQVQSKISKALMHLLMNNQVQFVYLWCCVLSGFVVQINDFFCLVLFSAVIHKRWGKKLISKKSGNEAISKWRKFLRHYDAIRWKTDMWFLRGVLKISGRFTGERTCWSVICNWAEIAL